MQNDLNKSLDEANTKLANIIASGKTDEILANPAFTKLHDTLSKLKKAGLSDQNGACNGACAPKMDKLGGELSNPA